MVFGPISYNRAIPPTTAAPSIPHAAVSKATAPPVEVAAVELPEEVLEEELLCASPEAVDSLALRSAAAPVKATAVTPVLFEQEDGSS